MGTPFPPQSPRKDFCRAKMPCGGEDCQICCSAVWSLYELQTSLQLQSRKRVLAKTVEDARPVRQYKTRPPGIAQGSADPCVFTRQRKIAISSRRLDTALLCAAKKCGVELPGWQVSASQPLVPGPRVQSKSLSLPQAAKTKTPFPFGKISGII